MCQPAEPRSLLSPPEPDGHRDRRRRGTGWRPTPRRRSPGTTTAVPSRSGCPRAGPPRRGRRRRPAATRGRPPPAAGSADLTVTDASTHAREARGHGRADGGAVPVLPGEPPREHERHADPEKDVLSPLEVGEQGVVEDPARRSEDGALELVDEQLTPDRQEQGEQHCVGRQQCPDDHAHHRAAPGQHESDEVQRSDQREASIRPPGCRRRRSCAAARARRTRAARSAGRSRGWERSRPG